MWLLAPADLRHAVGRCERLTEGGVVTLAPATPNATDPDQALSHLERPARPAVRVLIAAGTRTRAEQLQRVLDDPGVEVVALARPGDDVDAMLLATDPRAVLLDLDLDAGGLEFIERVMAVRPTPIVVCGAAAERPEVALAAGAVDVVGALDAPAATPEYAAALIRHLQVASRVRVISHPRARLRRPPQSGADGRRPHQVVVIGASTGGPPALAQVLGELPRAFEASIVVVQHMADGFVEGLARWLDESCRLPVVVAVDGERLRPGVVHIAPAGRNLLVMAGARVSLTAPTTAQFNVPAVDVAFTSVASSIGASAVGVLLTGMGRDGALGLRTLRNAGALTIGQDEETSVVWGMPAAAQELDAVDLELPLNQIGAAIVSGVRRKRLGSSVTR